MTWTEFLLGAIEHSDGEGALGKLADGLEHGTSHSAFSGINANHVSERVMALALTKRLGRKVRPSRVLSTDERDVECTLELEMLHEDDSACHFQDISLVFKLELQLTISMLENSPPLDDPSLDAGGLCWARHASGNLLHAPQQELLHPGSPQARSGDSLHRPFVFRRAA